jgi:hypothetical protein
LKNHLKLFKLSQKLDKNNLYSLADKIDRLAQNQTKNFENKQQALDYIKNLGMPSFSQNMDKAADEGVSINGISIKNDPEMQKLYKDSSSPSGAVAMPAIAPMPMPTMAPMPMPAPVAAVPPVV